MNENPFQPACYVVRQRRGLAPAGAAILAVLFFWISVPIWLWRRSDVGRILAASWIICAVCLSCDLYLYALSVRLGYPTVNILAVQAAGVPETVGESAVELRQVALPRPTVTPTVTPAVRPAAVLLPTVTPAMPTPAPLPTVTPRIDIPHWAVVTQGRLNLRAAPAADAEIIGKLATAACVEIVTVEPEWLEVRLATGEQGWSARVFLKLAAGCPPASAR
jgi:hypothetical protein